MKIIKLFLLILSLISVSAFAASTEEKLQKIADKANVHNGEAYVTRYHPTRFVMAKEIRKLEKVLPNWGGECTYFTQVGRRSNLKDFRDNVIDEEIIEDLEKLYDEGHLETIISRQYESGDTENCLRHFFKIYTVDGYLLTLSYDFTT